MINVRGYVDRIENGKIVIIVEPVEREVIVDSSTYPQLRTGDWLAITFSNNYDIYNVRVDKQVTDKQKSKVSALKQKLKKRSKYHAE